MTSSLLLSPRITGLSGVAALLVLFAAVSAQAQVDEDVPGDPDLAAESESESLAGDAEASPVESSAVESSVSEPETDEETKPLEEPRTSEADAEVDLGEKLEEVRENRDVYAETREPGATGGVSYWHGTRRDNNYFGWDGSLVIDVGYADYRFSTSSFAPEDFHDFRGYAEFGPVFEHRFGKDKQAFLRGQAQFVAWIREQEGIYQVNVFDVFAQIGLRERVDLQVGRFNSWRVYQRGNGFDIFTLEDVGAVCQPPLVTGPCPNMYEADFMWLRGTQGRAATHVYPLKGILPKGWDDFGLEGMVEYGKVNVSNSIGLRAAAIYDVYWARLSGAIEKRTFTPAARAQTVLPDGTVQVCPDCTKLEQHGFGGGIMVRPPYMEAAVNYADGNEKNFGSTGAAEPSGESSRVTVGGYAEFHTGHLIDRADSGEKPGHFVDQSSENIRQITIGYGINRTEWTNGLADFTRHTQHAAYIKYNFGFNESFLKLVGSRADALIDENQSGDANNPSFRTRATDMLAVRLRYGYFF